MPKLRSSYMFELRMEIATGYTETYIIRTYSLVVVS